MENRDNNVIRERPRTIDVGPCAHLDSLAQDSNEWWAILWDHIIGGYQKKGVDWALDELPIEHNCGNENMRLDLTNPNDIPFATFLAEVGTNSSGVLHIPEAIRKVKDINELLSTVYPNLGISGTSTPDYLTERIIFAAQNDDVESINALALQIAPGEIYTYFGADKMSEEDMNIYPSEYINSLNPPGFPPFCLTLKVGSPIILLRNISPRAGMCNGTRMRVERCNSHVIEARILTGDMAGNLEFIPRIPFSSSKSNFPFHMTRRQFPIRLAYVMTINQAQGQSVKYVGIDFRNHVFSHGQALMALSRVTCYDRVSVLLSEENQTSTVNVVYP